MNDFHDNSPRRDASENDAADARPVFHSTRSVFLPAICGVALFFAVAAHLSCSSQRPVEEVVTPNAERVSPTRTPPVAVKQAQLPAHDADIEAAGDKVAGAITLLKQRRNNNGAQTVARAQKAVSQASLSLSRALRRKSHDEDLDAALRDALRSLNLIETSIERGSYDSALRELETLDKRLDNIDVKFAAPAATPTPAEGTNSASAASASPQPSESAQTPSPSPPQF